MVYDIDYFVSSAIESGRFTLEQFNLYKNPCSNIAIDYAASILKSARREYMASVENLKVEVNDLDDFQYFYIDDVEVTTTAWNQALLELLENRFKAAFEGLIK